MYNLTLYVGGKPVSPYSSCVYKNLKTALSVGKEMIDDGVADSFTVIEKDSDIIMWDE